MILSFLLGLAAAVLAPRLDTQIRGRTAGRLGPEPLRDDEVRLFAFALALVIAALVAHLLVWPSALALTLGALLGAAIPRLRAGRAARRAPDYGPDPADRP